jgi:hypothetical protein
MLTKMFKNTLKNDVHTGSFVLVIIPQIRQYNNDLHSIYIVLGITNYLEMI